MPVGAMNFGWPAAGTAVGRADKMVKIDVSDDVDKPADKNRRLALLCVFLITFGIRLIFILETRGIATFRTPNPGMDIDLHWQAARMLVQGASQKEPCFELMIPSTPFHPYWLALWQIILGESLVRHRVLNAFLASLSAVLVFMLIQRLVQKQTVAWIFTLIWATLPSLIYFDGTLHKSALEIFALLILIWILINASKALSRASAMKRGISIGILLSVLVLLQGNTFFYIMIVSALILFDGRTHRRRRLFILMPAVVMFTATVLSYHWAKDPAQNKYPWFLPQKGIHFYIGFHQGATGTYHQVKGIKPWPYAHVFHTRLYAEALTGRKMTPGEADRFFLNKGLAFIRQHPQEAFKLAINKAFLFFKNFEVKGIDDLYYLKTRSLVLKLTPLGLGVLVLFSGIGTVRLVQAKAWAILWLFGGLLAAMLAANVLGFISWRYRLHNTVPLVVLAAFGFQTFIDQTRALFRAGRPGIIRSLRYALYVIFPLMVCGLLAYWPVPDKLRHSFFKRAAINDQLSRRAEKILETVAVLEQSPSHNPASESNKALLLHRIHRYTTAYRILRRLHQHEVQHPRLTYRYLVYLMWLTDFDQAAALMRRIKSLQPHYLPRIERFLKGTEATAYRVFVKPYI